MIASIMLRLMSEEQARTRLADILSRREFRGWINPVEILIDLLRRASAAFSGLPRAAQIVIAAALVLILILIFYHWATVIRRFVSSRKKDAVRSAGGSLEDLLASDLPADRIREQALSALKAGDFRNAVRLLYVCFILLLRDRGMVPALSSLTGREINRMVRSRLAGSDEAVRLFERSAYSPHAVTEGDASWMKQFLDDFNRTAAGAAPGPGAVRT
jgi:hypothetical protein